MKDPDNYSFERAYEEDAFLQLPLITWERFGRDAKERGVSLSIGSTLREQLQDLDRTGALRPIAFRIPGPPGYDELVFREGVEFKEWDEYPSGDELWSHRVLYCHWQLLYVAEAVELGIAEVSVDWFLRPKRDVSEAWLKWLQLRSEQRSVLDDGERPLMLLLVALQPRYYPIIRGTLTKITTTLSVDPETGREVDPYRRAVEDFDPQAVLERLSLTAEDVKNIYENVAAAGHMRDPLERFYMLTRMLPHAERARLRGAALLAQDRYDAAEMLRRFYFDLSNELLAAPDDMFDGSGGAWKERLFGHPPRLGFRPDDLHVELIRHRLYPHSVHVVVEGPTDELLIRGLLEALAGPVLELGVTFSLLRGVGRIRLNSEVLASAKRYARFPVLVVDREGDIEREIALLKRDGLVTDDTVFMWNRSLEEDNFTDEELVRVASSIAETRGARLDLTPERLREAYERQRSGVGSHGRGLADILLALCRHPNHGSVVLSKRELADGLRDLVLTELREGMDEEELVRRRPVMRIVLGIIRST